MKTKLVSLVATQLLEKLPDNLMKEALDDIIDKVENHVEASPNKIDDMLILPLCRRIRVMLDIEDGGD